MNWIKVEDGLPEVGVDVLFRYEEHEIPGEPFYAVGFADSESTLAISDMGIFDVTITHWAYITEPEPDES